MSLRLVASCVYSEHRRIPDIHEHLRPGGIVITECTVINLLARDEEWSPCVPPTVSTYRSGFWRKTKSFWDWMA